MSDYLWEIREQRRVSEIKWIVRDRKIEVLCHFTLLENLPGILQYGLLSRSTLTKRGMGFRAIDHERLDGCLDAVCLSISFPNFRMFHIKRDSFLNSYNLRDSQWVVLLWDARILWELECEFCQRNAASNLMRGVPRQERRKPEALESVFCDFDDTRYSEPSMPRNFPTDSQAEVLVLGQIPATYLRQVHFRDYSVCMEWLNYVRSVTVADVFYGSLYFSPRMVNGVWK